MGSDALTGLEFANLSKTVQTISYPPASASQVLYLAGSMVNISKEVVEGIKHMSQSSRNYLERLGALYTRGKS